MSISVRFTVRGISDEITFTVVEEEDQLYLYSQSEDQEYKYPLIQEKGRLKLEKSDQFLESSNVIEERLIGLSADWIEYKSQGFDSDTTITINKKPGYGPEHIFVENKPFSLRQIVELIDNKDMELTPDFQRNFIWDKTRQSRLIESLLLGLPLPSLYLSQYEDGRLTVVDGLQRLSTIRSFMRDELVLSNLEYLEDCKGKKYSQLTTVISPLRLRKFAQTQIMCFVIDYRSPAKLKFDLFIRLNTGGKPLNNQEIRNCLSRPSVQTILKAMADLPSFFTATDNSVKDARMDAREAALRFIYFRTQYTVENSIGRYNGDMESTLDEFIDELNGWKTEKLNQYLNLYDKALKNAYHLFGNYCFRKILPDNINGRRPPINKLMMLTLCVLLSDFESDTIISKLPKEALVEPISNLISNEELFRVLTYGTNARYNIQVAYSAFASLLGNIKIS